MSNDSEDPRVVAFRAKKIRHLLLSSVLDDVIRLVDYPRPESVVVLVGPSGVGKSTVIRRAEKHLLKKYAEEMDRDPGFIPYLSVKANAPLDGHFNWKDFFIRALHSGGDVLLTRRRSSRFQLELDGQRIDALTTLVREELRRSLESLVHNRRVKAIFIDEASGMLFLRAGMRPLLQFDILKCLAIELGIPIYLAGAYDLLGILDGSGQLLRRSEVIHFGRYLASGKTNDVTHLQAFADVLTTFFEAMDIPRDEGLSNHVEFFLAKSIGCVGVLKDWLERSMAGAIAGGGRLTRAVVERHALSNRDLIKLASEARTGEMRLEDSSDDDLAKALGLTATPSLSAETGERGVAMTGNQRTRRSAVGLRGPSRDPVGVPHD